MAGRPWLQHDQHPQLDQRSATQSHRLIYQNVSAKCQDGLFLADKQDAAVAHLNSPL